MCALTPVHHRNKRVSLAGCCRFEVNVGTLWNNTRRIVAQGNQRFEKRVFVLVRCASHVLTDARRQTINLQELRQIANRKVLEQVRPDQHAIQTRLTGKAGFRVMLMDHPAERHQLCTVDAAIIQADIIATVRACLEPAMRPEVGGAG